MINVWLYKANKTDNSSLDDLIAGWTKPFNKGTPPYSHAEIEKDGVCFSATLRDDSTGTRMELAEKVLRNIKRWHRYTKQFTPEEEQVMWDRALKILGRPYAKVCLVVSFLMPFGWLGTKIAIALNHWYCSMCVYYVITGKIIRISPRKLSRWLIKNGWIKISSGNNFVN